MKLIVIDMQKALVVDVLYNYKNLVKNIKTLIDEARNNHIEVIYVKHDAGAGTGLSVGDIGFEIIEQIAPKENEKVFIKKINSCFGNPDFTEYLKQSEDKRLMIVGLQTDFCVDATIKSAFEKGYQVIIPNGCNSTFDNNVITGKKVYQFYNEWVWPNVFGKCISLDEATTLLKE